jgi:predicted phosphodiesterase
MPQLKNIVAYRQPASKGVAEMIFVTGDTHIPIDINKLSTSKFSQQKNLTAEDYVIICGDFGGVWDRGHEEQYWLKWFNNKKFTTLFIDGNHENHQMLNEEFPIVQFCEGKAHKISEKIFHLMRGQVFALNDKKVFAMGGASSHDKEYRKEGENWWAQELPSQQEYQDATDTLELHGWKVNYIITHCAPDSIQRQIKSDYEVNELTHFLENIKNKLSFDRWYFGHYHVDKQINDKYTCLFERIVAIG